MRASLALLLLFGLIIRSEARLKNKISSRVAKALSAPTSVVLYSLDPAVTPGTSDPKLHTFKILGKAKLEGKHIVTALNAFNQHSGQALNRGQFDKLGRYLVSSDEEGPVGEAVGEA
jgi:hypothetical protein